jgi:hypothetical protein
VKPWLQFPGPEIPKGKKKTLLINKQNTKKVQGNYKKGGETQRNRRRKNRKQEANWQTPALT